MSREPNVEEPLLGQKVYDGLFHLRWDAAQAHGYLRQSWRRPVRHNLGIERWALWHVLDLNNDCHKAIMGWEDWYSRYLMRPPIGELTARYEVQAGILTVHHVIPFDSAERERLDKPRSVGPGVWHDVIGEQEPDLIERWHTWLWTDEQGNQVRRDDLDQLGASATLAEACGRLAVSLSPLVDDRRRPLQAGT